MSKIIRDKRTLKTIQYIAGFFDGEGSIIIAKILNKKSGNYWYRLNMSCSNTFFEPIYLLHKTFTPNKKAVIYRGGRKHGYRDSAQWLATGNVALKAIRQLEPYFLVKKKQAKLAIQFQEWRNSLPNTGKKRTQSILKKCEIFRNKMRKLNSVGIRSRND